MRRTSSPTSEIGFAQALRDGRVALEVGIDLRQPFIRRAVLVSQPRISAHICGMSAKYPADPFRMAVKLDTPTLLIEYTEIEAARRA